MADLYPNRYPLYDTSVAAAATEKIWHDQRFLYARVTFTLKATQAGTYDLYETDESSNDMLAYTISAAANEVVHFTWEPGQWRLKLNFTNLGAAAATITGGALEKP